MLQRIPRLAGFTLAQLGVLYGGSGGRSQPALVLEEVEKHFTAAELVAAVAATHGLRDLSVEEPDVEEVVRRLYGTTGG